MLEVTQIIVVRTRYGEDIVSLQTPLPSPCPGLTAAPLTVQFHAERGTGEDYATEHFPGVPCELVSYPGGPV